MFHCDNSGSDWSLATAPPAAELRRRGPDGEKMEPSLQCTWLKGTGWKDAAERGTRCVDEWVDLTAWTDSQVSEPQ